VILADTTIWVDHIRGADAQMTTLLYDREVLMHPMVLGEIALGALPRRAQLLADLRALPEAPTASAEEVLVLIERELISQTGIGYVDTHLVASCLLRPELRLWTRDRKLLRVADRLDVAAPFRLH
jgi:predicted nucleic acid-binding protein